MNKHWVHDTRGFNWYMEVSRLEAEEMGFLISLFEVNVDLESGKLNQAETYDAIAMKRELERCLRYTNTRLVELGVRQQ